jgi:hypothetical protein
VTSLPGYRRRSIVHHGYSFIAPLRIVFLRVGIAWREKTGDSRDQWSMKYGPKERIGYEPPREHVEED